MSENYYTVKDAMRYLNISKPTIYAWMDKGKLEFKETSKGRLVLLSDDKIQEHQELATLYNEKSENNRQTEQIENNSNTVSNSQDIILSLIEQLNKTNAELVAAAEERGKVKLLTDNILTDKEILKKLSEDSEFYKNEYFKVKYNLEQLTKINEEITKENQDLKNQLNQKSGFLGLFKK